jgi:hypothetical protein
MTLKLERAKVWGDLETKEGPNTRRENWLVSDACDDDTPDALPSAGDFEGYLVRGGVMPLRVDNQLTFSVGNWFTVVNMGHQKS